MGYQGSIVVGWDVPVPMSSTLPHRIGWGRSAALNLLSSINRYMRCCRSSRACSWEVDEGSRPYCWGVFVCVDVDELRFGFLVGLESLGALEALGALLEIMLAVMLDRV